MNSSWHASEEEEEEEEGQIFSGAAVTCVFDVVGRGVELLLRLLRSCELGVNVRWDLGLY